MAVELSLIVPAFNEEPRLAAGFKRLDAAVADGALDLERTEVLFVDDGSTDATADSARVLLAGFPHHRVVSHHRNRGKGAAIRTGVSLARGDTTAYMDADFAIDPRALPRLLEGLRSHDLAIGSRALPESMVDSSYALRTVMGRLFNRLVTTGTGLALLDTQCGFKAFRTPVARLLFELVAIDRFAFDVEILARAHRLGLSVTEVAVHWTHVPGSTIHPLHDSIRMLRDVYASRLGWGPTPVVATVVVDPVELRADRPGDLSLSDLTEAVERTAADALGGVPVPVLGTGGSVVVLLPLVDHRGQVEVITALRERFGVEAVSRRGSTPATLEALGPLAGRFGD